MKKAVSTVLFFTLAVNTGFSCFAADSTTVPSVNPQTQVLNKENKKLRVTMKEAFDIAYSSNVELKLLDLSISKLNRKHMDDLENADRYRNAESRYVSENVYYKRIAQIDHKKSLLQLNNSKNEKLEKYDILKSTIEKDYLNVLTIQGDLRDLKKEIENFDKKLQEADIKNESGFIDENNKKQLETQKMQLIASENRMERQMEEAMLTLKKDMGIDLGRELILVDPNIQYSKFDDKDIEKTIDEIANKSYTVEKYKKDLEISDLEFDLVKKYSNGQYYIDTYNFSKNDVADYPLGPEAQELARLEAEIKNKKLALIEGEYNFRISLWNSYYNIKNMEDEIEIAKLNKESAYLNLKLLEEKANLGMVNESELSKTRIEFSRQSTALEKAINNYYIAVQDFKNNLKDDN